MRFASLHRENEMDRIIGISSKKALVMPIAAILSLLLYISTGVASTMGEGSPLPDDVQSLESMPSISDNFNIDSQGLNYYITDSATATISGAESASLELLSSPVIGNPRIINAMYITMQTKADLSKTDDGSALLSHAYYVRGSELDSRTLLKSDYSGTNAYNANFYISIQNLFGLRNLQDSQVPANFWSNYDSKRSASLSISMPDENFKSDLTSSGGFVSSSSNLQPTAMSSGDQAGQSTDEILQDMVKEYSIVDFSSSSQDSDLPADMISESLDVYLQEVSAEASQMAFNYEAVVEDSGTECMSSMTFSTQIGG